MLTKQTHYHLGQTPTQVLGFKINKLIKIPHERKVISFALERRLNKIQQIFMRKIKRIL
jgi:hypothetical protein